MNLFKRDQPMNQVRITVDDGDEVSVDRFAYIGEPGSHELEVNAMEDPVGFVVIESTITYPKTTFERLCDSVVEKFTR